MTESTPTPEEIEIMRQQVMAHDFAMEEQRKADARALLEPLIEAGIGAETLVNCTIAELVEIMKIDTAGIAAVDPLLPSLLSSTAMCATNLHQRVQWAWSANQPTTTQA